MALYHWSTMDQSEANIFTAGDTLFLDTASNANLVGVEVTEGDGGTTTLSYLGKSLTFGNTDFQGGVGQLYAEDGSDLVIDTDAAGINNSNLALTNFSDQAYLGGGDDTLSGGNGNDLVYGADGNDDLSGGAGNDTLDGGAHNNTIAGEGDNNTLDGGSGDDSLLGGTPATTRSRAMTATTP
ncbi:MAG: calcium-binding protein [Caulobacteraceae bacterium]